MGQPIHVFCCYARKDLSFLLELKNWLIPFQRNGLIMLHADIDISPGEEWEQTIRRHLDTAQLILLLVSADFLASEYCYSVEMEKALKRHERKEARVIPIILRPSHFQQTPFSKLQVLPTGARPVTNWSNHDDAFLDVINGIEKAIEEIKILSRTEVPPSHNISIISHKMLAESNIATQNVVNELEYPFTNGSSLSTIPGEDPGKPLEDLSFSVIQEKTPQQATPMQPKSVPPQPAVPFRSNLDAKELIKPGQQGVTDTWKKVLEGERQEYHTYSPSQMPLEVYHGSGPTNSNVVGRNMVNYDVSERRTDGDIAGEAKRTGISIRRHTGLPSEIQLSEFAARMIMDYLGEVEIIAINRLTEPSTNQRTLMQEAVDRIISPQGQTATERKSISYNQVLAMLRTMRFEPGRSTNDLFILRDLHSLVRSELRDNVRKALQERDNMRLGTERISVNAIVAAMGEVLNNPNNFGSRYIEQKMQEYYQRFVDIYNTEYHTKAPPKGKYAFILIEKDKNVVKREKWTKETWDRVRLANLRVLQERIQLFCSTLSVGQGQIYDWALIGIERITTPGPIHSILR